MRIGPTDSNLDALNRHLAESEAGAHGEEEGARCNRGGSDGTMDWPRVENCSRHVYSPCGHCERLRGTSPAMPGCPDAQKSAASVTSMTISVVAMNATASRPGQ